MIPTPAERLKAQTVFHAATVRLGVYEARPDEPLFQEFSPPGHDVVAFPETELLVNFARGGDYLIDPTTATFYHSDEVYEREAIDPRGDRCTWISAEPALMEELVGEHYRLPVGCSRFFSLPVGYLPARLFHEHRVLMQRVRAEAACELEIEESAIGLLGRLFAETWPNSRGTGARSLGTRPLRTMRSVVAQAKELLAAEFREPLSVSQIADRIGCSPFYLCRAFRADTGDSLHGYRTALRLRHGFDELMRGRRDIAAIALDVGFSNHSHFTARFRREFDLAPRSVRES